jgi:predicted ABC-type ATPase
MPEMWIIAGPNGAGKTTLTREYFSEAISDKAWINPDDTTLLLRNSYKDLLAPPRDTANRLGAIISDTRADHMLATGQSFIVETVLSSDKHLQRVRAARVLGFSVTMIYVTLRSPELAVKRVKQRFEAGGHDVPEDKIRERWVRSLANLMMFLPMADSFTVWDNSTDATTEEPPILLIDNGNKGIQVYDQIVFEELMANAADLAVTMGHRTLAADFQGFLKP